MATNQVPIVLDTCTRTVAAITKLCEALDELEAIQEKLHDSNPEIILTDYTTEIEGGNGISHCKPTTYVNILSAFAPHIKTEMQAYYDGAPTQQGWAALMECRRWSTSV
jgi:hypothetical protein